MKCVRLFLLSFILLYFFFFFISSSLHDFCSSSWRNYTFLKEGEFFHISFFCQSITIFLHWLETLFEDLPFFFFFFFFVVCSGGNFLLDLLPLLLFLIFLLMFLLVLLLFLFLLLHFIGL